MNNALKPIGIFDSGLGGLTVMSEVIKLMPGEDVVYVGDTARVPYGSKSKEAVTRFSSQIANFLLRKNVKMIVVACNTASALALGNLKNRLKIPVIGVIEPGSRAAVKATKKGRVGVVGTEGTIRSSSYTKAIKGLNEKIKVYTKACPLFVPLVEEGWLKNNITYLTAKEYLKPLLKNSIDTLVLGCTHYPLLKGLIRKVAGGRVRLVDSAAATAKEVLETLILKGLKSGKAGRGKYRFFVSDSPDKFKVLGRRFLGNRISQVTKVVFD